MKYNVNIVLDIICHNIDAEAAANFLTIYPDEILKKGSRNKKLNLPRNDVLSFISQASKWESDLEEHWKSISEMASINKNSLSEISNNCDIKLTIVVDHRGRFPSLYMPKEFVKFAGDINAVIDIDVYE